MTKRNRFPSARLCLLRTGGELIDADGTPADADGVRHLTISRGLCRHHRFAPAAPLSPRALARAARLYAEMHCPFKNADWLLMRGRSGIAIWWWDAARIRTMIGDRWAYHADCIIPETLHEPPGEGWRIVRVADGEDAQYWRAGELIASHWRRTPFDRAAWAMLSLGADGEAIPTADMPEAIDLASPETVMRPPARLRPEWDWTNVSQAAMAVTIAALALGGFWSGRAMSVERTVEAELARVEAIEAGQSPGIDRVVARLATLRAVGQASAGGDAVQAGASALAIFERFGVPVADWRFDEQTARIAIPADQAGSLLDAAAALEADPMFAGVRAESGRDGMILIDADIVPVRRPTRDLLACATCP